jgi:hypothetical protein
VAPDRDDAERPEPPLTTPRRATGASAPGGDALDVELLMEDLRRRVAEKKALGLYGVDALMEASAEDDGEPFGFDELERLRELAVQRVDIEVAASTKPVVGSLISRAKRLLVRGASQPMYGLSAQATAFNGALLAYLSSVAREVAALDRQLHAVHEASEASSAEATRLREDVARVLDRVEASDAAVARLADAALPERVARLERAPAAAAPPAAATGPPPAATGGDPVRLRLEATGSDEATARVAAYAETLVGHGPVLHLGAGSGRALHLLGDDAEGVEADAELAAAAAAEGRAVRHADPVAFLGALAPGSVGGILVTDLVERLDGPGLVALAAAVARALAPEGHAVVEGLHPAALWAMGDEFWRDPGRRRPLHPDAIRMSLEAAGLGATSVDLLDAPEALRLDPAAMGALAPVAERVNDALFGPRRYAVHATH